MKKMFVVLAVVILSGCGGVPAYKVRAFGDENGCMAFYGREVLFTIVTDGQIGSGGVSTVILRGPRYKGTILPPGGGEELPFHAANGKLHIDSQSYDLTSGNLFLVSVAGESKKVSQIDVSEEDKIESVLQTDDRATSFF
ncbi:MAG: hypothetical protein ACYSWQ_05380 [Planctomycetota bacterium]|jgi:hypothetical protein